MTRTVLVRRVFALGSALALAAAGCELAVDFDRTKIDAGSVDASIADVVSVDSPIGTDSGRDAQSDAAADSPSDAPAESSGDANTPDADAGVDAPVDAPADAPDDAPVDADDAG